jgi:hypothetical protein
MSTTWQQIIEAGRRHAEWSERLRLMLETGEFNLKDERIPALIELIERQTVIIKSTVQGLKDFEVF